MLTKRAKATTLKPVAEKVTLISTMFLETLKTLPDIVSGKLDPLMATALPDGVQ